MNRPLHRILAAAVVAAALLPTTWLPGPATAASPERAAAGRALLDRTIAAHGGLETWRSYRRLDYAVRDFPLGANAPFDYEETVALGPRHYRADGDGYAAGFDGREAWVTPEVAALGLPPRFFLSGNFYFVAMPFVFADPGIDLAALEPAELGGRRYERVAVSYGAGVGDSDADDYILYLDPATHRLHMIDFRPTSNSIRGDTPVEELPRKVLVFDEWQRASGLLVPARATFRTLENGRLGEDGASYSVTDVRFAVHAPSPALFAAPDDAVLDRSHLAD
jgi:hypothetical protein